MDVHGIQFNWSELRQVFLLTFPTFHHMEQNMQCLPAPSESTSGGRQVDCAAVKGVFVLHACDFTRHAYHVA